MAESKTVGASYKYRYGTNKKVGHIKMKLLDDLCKETTNEQVEISIDGRSSAMTDGANNYNDLKENLAAHKAVVAKVKPACRTGRKEASKILPWVHIAISPECSGPKDSYWTCTDPSATITFRAIWTNIAINSTEDISIRCSTGS